jgi:hypothetical protein
VVEEKVRWLKKPIQITRAHGPEAGPEFHYAGLQHKPTLAEGIPQNFYQGQNQFLVFLCTMEEF